MIVERETLTRAEAAQALGLSLGSIDRRIADGTLHAVRIGARVVIPRWAVTELLGKKASA